MTTLIITVTVGLLAYLLAGSVVIGLLAGSADVDQARVRVLVLVAVVAVAAVADGVLMVVRWAQGWRRKDGK